MGDLGTIADYGACDSFLINFIDECQSIVAEVLRLIDFLPNDFCNPNASSFKPLLLDFRYFSKVAAYEKELSIHENLQDTFYSKFGDVISRFELLFQTLAGLLLSFVEYTRQVSYESTLFIDSTRELEAEALSAVASVVLHFDRLIDGWTRERIYVAIYRHSEDRSHVEFLVDFLRQDIETNDQHPIGEFMSQRVKVDPKFVENCISFFERIGRNTRQSSLRRISSRMSECLFGCLLFAQKTRDHDHSRMKFFIDNFFRDQWVISISLGMSLSVADEWYNSPAARAAFLLVFTNERVKELARSHYETLSRKEYISNDIVPEKFEMYIDGLQRLNTSLKWMILHTDKKLERMGKNYTSLMDVTGKFQSERMDTVIRISSFEMQFLKVYRKYVRDRKDILGTIRDDICSIIGEFADIFSNGFASLKLEKREKLSGWLLLIKKSLEEMDLDVSSNSELVQQIKRRFLQVGEMLDLGGNMAMAHFLERLHQKLDSLASGLATTEDGERRIERAADSPYLWTLIGDFVPVIQLRLLQSSRSQPVRVLFYKLALSIGQHCEGLQSEDRKHLIGRAYSCYLERRLRDVLQSVPHQLFKMLYTDVIPCLKHQWNPTIEKTKVKDMPNFEENAKLSTITYRISNMSVGISRFSLRTLGTIEVNPKELLEEGIRRELRSELPRILSFSEKDAKDKDPDLESLIAQITLSTWRVHSAFIYMCDHIGVSGHDLWREELSTHMDNVIDVLDKAWPKKVVGSQDALFIVYHLLLKKTNPMLSYYFENEMIWRDRKSGKETFSGRLADMIEKWIPCYGIHTLESKLQLDTASALKETVLSLRNAMSSFGRNYLEAGFFVSKDYDQLSRTIALHQRQFLTSITKIGQLVLLRNVLSQATRMHGRMRATSVFVALEAANQQLLSDSTSVSPVVYSVVSLARMCGCFTSPQLLSDIPSPPTHASLCLLILLILTLPRLNGAKKDSVCQQSFFVGLSVVIHNTNCMDDLIDLCVKFDMDNQVGNPRLKTIDFSNMLEQLCI